MDNGSNCNGPMKALTISQPFASLIASGEKWVENRTWETRYRGPLAIHAGKGTQYLTRRDLDGYPAGAVVAVAQLVGCANLWDWSGYTPSDDELFPNTKTRLKAFLDHEHTEGPWCWILEDVTPVQPPVLATGRQGLWDINLES